MPDDITRMDIAEFQRLGYLQEANRLFFHPHGLALEVTRITEKDYEGGPVNALWLTDVQVALFRGLLESAGERAAAEWGEGSEHEQRILTPASEALDAAMRYEVGDVFLSGVWDYRSDPEGIVFGAWDDKTKEMAATVLAERRRHFDARCALFRVPAAVAQQLNDADVEPLGFVHPSMVEKVEAP